MLIHLLHHQFHCHRSQLFVGHELVRDGLDTLHASQDRRQALRVKCQLELGKRVVAGLVTQVVVLLQITDDLIEEELILLREVGGKALVEHIDDLG